MGAVNHRNGDRSASLIALPLPQALEAAGERVARVLVTGPPGAGKGQGVPRVVRQRQVSDGLELTVAFPTPPPTGPDDEH